MTGHGLQLKWDMSLHQYNVCNNVFNCIFKSGCPKVRVVDLISEQQRVMLCCWRGGGKNKMLIVMWKGT